MTKEDAALLDRRKAVFDDFYDDLLECLVDFVDKMGIGHAHKVLKQADLFVPYLARALEKMEVDGDDERIWLLARVGYFLGEYFVQRYGGCWYVNDIPGSRYFARYIVGQFSRLGHPTAMIDPFQAAEVYVDTPAPRDLEKLIAEVEAELGAVKQPR
jgi:hypothetical protein